MAFLGRKDGCKGWHAGWSGDPGLAGRGGCADRGWGLRRGAVCAWWGVDGTRSPTQRPWMRVQGFCAHGPPNALLRPSRWPPVSVKVGVSHCSAEAAVGSSSRAKLL
ncbi:hypothetical protein GGTG_06128 [Gaeumannomyces tritici R3-111a-1]|uniref:Uncharacterized protein n=1 Tax=Gaeumannomyces tritici (strain R3-111a-1) TaxID=644352 RepID=J3NXX3_GAET3|nr:hypothetical protein GGTG_06128 [Gaeumannomyces tritici R3-111a-1]EJT76206.1 hypothetical protein GGTG_06128 [Gaeumannomyces tritici R3-111a-1]